MPKAWLLSTASCFFIKLRTGSFVLYNPFENPNWSINKITSFLTGVFFKYFSNDSQNTYMIVVLPRASVTLLPKAGSELVCLLELCLQLHKNWKLSNVFRKKYLDCFRIFTGMHYWVAVRVLRVFYFSKYIINTDTWKLEKSPIGEIIDSNDTCILGFLLNLKIVFNIRWDVFSAKG